MRAEFVGASVASDAHPGDFLTFAVWWDGATYRFTAEYVWAPQHKQHKIDAPVVDLAGALEMAVSFLRMVAIS